MFPLTGYVNKNITCLASNLLFDRVVLPELIRYSSRSGYSGRNKNNKSKQDYNNERSEVESNDQEGWVFGGAEIELPSMCL